MQVTPRAPAQNYDMLILCKIDGWTARLTPVNLANSTLSFLGIVFPEHR